MFLKGPTVAISNCHQPSQNVQSICSSSKRAEASTVPRNIKYPALLYCCCCWFEVGPLCSLVLWRLETYFKQSISFIFSVQSAPLNSPTGRLEEVSRLSLDKCLIVYAHLISSTGPERLAALSMSPQSYYGLNFILFFLHNCITRFS